MHAITIRAKLEVGLIKDSKFQFKALASFAKMINWEFGMIGVQTLIAL